MFSRATKMFNVFSALRPVAFGPVYIVPLLLLGVLLHREETRNLATNRDGTTQAPFPLSVILHVLTHAVCA